MAHAHSLYDNSIARSLLGESVCIRLIASSADDASDDT
jgi:hypothetical protein